MRTHPLVHVTPVSLKDIVPCKSHQPHTSKSRLSYLCIVQNEASLVRVIRRVFAGDKKLWEDFPECKCSVMNWGPQGCAFAQTHGRQIVLCLLWCLSLSMRKGVVVRKNSSDFTLLSTLSSWLLEWLKLLSLHWNTARTETHSTAPLISFSFSF